MPRKQDERMEQAKEMFRQGQKLVEIASQLNLPEGTIRSWKNRYKWECNDADRKCNVANGKCNDINRKCNVANEKCSVANKKRGGQPGNKNAVGNRGGAPKQNRNAEKYGFFSRYLPEETREIFSAIEEADPLDLLWHQIQLAYAAIIRAQRSTGRQETDRQNAFLQAQARAQSELRSMIRQYDEMLHKDWEMAGEEQKARLEQIRARTASLNRADAPDREDGVTIVNDAPKEAGQDI